MVLIHLALWWICFWLAITGLAMAVAGASCLCGLILAGIEKILDRFRYSIGG